MARRAKEIRFGPDDETVEKLSKIIRWRRANDEVSAIGRSYLSKGEVICEAINHYYEALNLDMYDDEELAQ